MSIKVVKKNRSQKANAMMSVTHLPDGTAVYAGRFVEVTPGKFKDLKLWREHEEWKRKRDAKKAAKEANAAVTTAAESGGSSGDAP